MLSDTSKMNEPSFITDEVLHRLLNLTSSSLLKKELKFESIKETALSKTLGPEFQIILIGLSKAQRMEMPKNIIALGRTQNVTELAQYYSCADVVFNPTVEDNFPTVNIEALACGTPVFTFDTGGSPECLAAGCGKVVSADSNS